MLSLSRYLKGHIENCLVYSSEQTHTFLSPQTIFSTVGIIGCGVALFVSWRAHKQSAKSTGPDMELVRRFVETAPWERLAAIQKSENEHAAQDGDDERKGTEV
ncbi:MAG TPA: hypothetical protein DC031_20595 [Sulfitobacter sp.]|jgi:hypothetical protein|nr:hypothetical protein [Sulfitobacter sp.]HBB85596.1 hypothetical protein [Sulfitobacter sp.]